MNTHDERHELAIERWLTDDDPAGREAAQAHAAQCQECAEQLAELRTMTAVLDGMHHERDEILALARNAPQSPRAHVLDAAARAGYPLPPRANAPRRLPQLVGAALAIAALVAVAFVLGRNDGADATRTADEPTPALVLSPTELTCVSPRGNVASFERFDWTYELRSGETFTLFVRDPNHPDTSVMDPLDELHASSCVVLPALANTFPRTIEWQVCVVGPAGEIMSTSEWVRASRPAN